MKYIYILSLLLLSITMWAQGGDKPRGGISIPRKETSEPIPDTPSESTPTPFDFEPKKKIDPRFMVGVDNTDKSPLTIESKYVNRSSEYEDKVKIKPKGESNDAFKGNISYGEIRTKSAYIDVYAADFGAEDGDRIRILINDRVIIDDFTLTNFNKTFQIMLLPGFNKIEFEALNQGTSGPNTAQFRIFDDGERVLLAREWNLATGFKASTVIIREAADTPSQEKAQ